MTILFLLFVVLTIMTLVGHFIWVIIAHIARWVFVDKSEDNEPLRLLDPLTQKLDDLATTERQIVQFYTDGKLSEEIYQQLMKQIRAERLPLLNPQPVAQPSRPKAEPKPFAPSPVVNAPEVVIAPVPSFIPPTEPEPQYQQFTPPKQPRRSFSEVLNSFMEESNIRWGEIIGGLLIIGCSTALVVSLWAQISEIPVLKFLIFTTVTAVLFGIGLYTEHRWKLPTTSRGILTIATLLVPLNFLAIAAVSASNSNGALVIASELLAPAIFLCLVYFAGRVITPGCAHVLSAGVLGSSVGQLLVRHFASIDAPPIVLIALGAFPVMCYVVTVALALRFVLRDRQIDEGETTTVFTVLGTMSFAALLPFSLLLYKSGPLSMSMMYLAPIVTLWGLPLVATGTILWRRITNKELVASRTTGTALGILGLMIVLAGMILAWPNPSSIVPAALLNFAMFTVLAIVLELPLAHLIATACFALAYLVTFHVFAGNITWVNLRVMSLLEVSLSVASGQALVGAFALFVAASEWLTGLKRERDSRYYFVSGCYIAVLSLTLVGFLGVWSSEYHALWLVYGLYSAGAFWLAWRRKLVPFTWIGSGLLLCALAHSFGHVLSLSFPWQTALFAHATLCAVAAIVSTRYRIVKTFASALNYTALISLVLGVASLFQTNPWQVTSMQAQRAFWIAGILLVLLWLSRRRIIFNTFQIALLSALVLTVKAGLQQFEWYSYLPHAFLRPAALQIQGTVLALFCLAWVAVRIVVRRALPGQAEPDNWLIEEWRLLDTKYSVDRIVMWALAGGLMVLVAYGALPGIALELTGWGRTYSDFNIAGFSYQEAYALGSWIVLGLLTIAMLASFKERRRVTYLLGAVAVLSAAIPLLAGQFENQIATATAWRWFAVLFLLCGSSLVWLRNRISPALASFGRTKSSEDTQGFAKKVRTVLIVLTLPPLILLTLYTALQTVFDVSVQGAASGVFASFSQGFSYAGPLVLVALVMIGYALRERLPVFSFTGGIFFNLTVTLAFLLTVVSSGGVMDRVVLVRLAQLNAITLAAYLLPWLSTRSRWQSALDEREARLANYLIKLQLGSAVVLDVLLLLPLVLALVLTPSTVAAGTFAAGSLLGWLALFTIVVAAAWLAANKTIRLSADALAGLLLAVNSLIAFNVSDLSGWCGLHTLTVSTAVAAWLMLAAADLTSDTLPFPLSLTGRAFDLDSTWQARCRKLAVALGVLTLFLSLRILTHLGSAWWSIGSLLAITALAAMLNWKTQRRRYIYAAGILFNLAVSVWWIFVAQSYPLSEFLLTNLIAGSLAGILWLWLELRARKLSGSETAIETNSSFHNVVAILSLGVLALFVFSSFLVAPMRSPLLQSPVLVAYAFTAVLALIIACLWDRYAKYAVGGLYVLGLVGIAFVIHECRFTREDFAWSFVMLLSLYNLMCAVLWRRRVALISFAQEIGITPRLDLEATELPWFSAATILAVATIGTLTYSIVLNSPDFEVRAEVAFAFIAQFLTLAVLADGKFEQRWRRAAVVVLITGATLFGWSSLTTGVDATWLNRSVILMVEAFGLTALYALFLEKAKTRLPEWINPARWCTPWVLGAGVVALVFCLGTEIFYQINFGDVRIHPVSLLAIGLTLVAAVVICVLFALSPNHDPLNLSERGRTRYVYAAETMLALLFLHIRLTMPWLFTGFIERYWPIAVMLIAYFGVVASEGLRRRKLFVLAHPLERTGAFLPLLPVLGFWLASSEVDFSLLLFVIGGLYGLLSILRRSFLFGILAAIAGNAGLWYVYHRTSDYQFLQHPQLWLIPVALSVLLAAYLNEDRLIDDQMTGVRYLSLMTIYASSTSDIFINGVANSPWLPLILGSFALTGVFAGIVFRIRGLLLLGSVFLLLSIITMIWYASANLGWTWLWYVAGIMTGATIIFMFAVFEKKRGEVLRLVEGLKEWDR